MRLLRASGRKLSPHPQRLPLSSPRAASGRKFLLHFVPHSVAFFSRSPLLPVGKIETNSFSFPGFSSPAERRFARNLEAIGFLETPFPLPLAASHENRFLAIAFPSRHGVPMLPDTDRAAAPAHLTGFPDTPLCHAGKIETKAATFFSTEGKNLVESLWILFLH